MSDTVSVETSVGSLYLHADDEFITPHLQKHGSWELGESALLVQHLRPGMTFLDIGAHVGYFSCQAAQLVGKRGLVLAFEPHPRNYELLLANVWRNGLSNVLCFPWAVSDHSGYDTLYAAGRNTGDHRLYASDEQRQGISVRAIALDSLAALRPPVDVVKIDVQGAEDAVVLGMERLLAASPNALLLVEYWPHGIRLRGHEELGVLDYYRSLGYRIQVQHPDRTDVAKLSDRQIVEYCKGADGVQHTNLVLKRSGG